MNVIRLLKALSVCSLLSVSNIVNICMAIFKHGLNLMTLIQFATYNNKDKIAIIDDHETLTYNELLLESLQLANFFKHQYAITPNLKIGIYCRNHAMLVKVIFAISRLGGHIYFINTELGEAQFKQLVKKHQFDLFIYDDQFNKSVKHQSIPKALRISEVKAGIIQYVGKPFGLKRVYASRLVILTSGTTATPKEIIHQPSLFNYLDPFIAMVQRLKLAHYQTGYIATPLYHGFGIAILCLFVMIGKQIILCERFHATQACQLIEQYNVEMITVVPLMLHKMLAENKSALHSLKCIASGGAPLDVKLINKVSRELGNILFNLYGTSETGLNIIATPSDLSYNPKTIGKKIEGIKLKILQEDSERIGQLYVKSKSSMVKKHNKWIATGDLARKDNNHYYYLLGRIDDMIVSAGVNVYPIQLEHILLQHPLVEDAVVIGVDDEQFGQRLHAFLKISPQVNIHSEIIYEWLQSKVARYEMPKEITFVDKIPYTALGKKDKKQFNNSFISKS